MMNFFVGNIENLDTFYENFKQFWLKFIYFDIKKSLI